ncbi:MAG: hypothetical protein ACLSHW_03755 [Lachnospiraceae bacterium]
MARCGIHIRTKSPTSVTHILQKAFFKYALERV